MSGKVPILELVAVFGKVGLLSFGGPAGQIALMHRVLVDERKWLDEDQFLHALNFCMVLPGPEAMQLATYAGWLKDGHRGGLIAGLLFVLPGFVVVTALSAAYVAHGDLPVVKGMLFGLAAAVLAVVAEALLKVSKRALKGPVHLAIAIFAFVAIALLKLPFPLIIAAAAIVGAVFLRKGVNGNARADAKSMAYGQSLMSAAVFGSLWAGPLAVLTAMGGVYAAQALFFSKAAVVTFGGAYAVLAYVGQQAVDVHGWLSARDMITGLGLAETTMGPLILVLVFVGYLGGANAAAGSAVVGGLGGALTALWFTFVPCFLWVFAGAPFMERLRGVEWLSAALGAVTAAVVGVIANLAVWFGLSVLFGPYEEFVLGPISFPDPDPAALNPAALAIAVAASIALLRYHVNLLIVLAVSALIGVGVIVFG